MVSKRVASSIKPHSTEAQTLAASAIAQFPDSALARSSLRSNPSPNPVVAKRVILSFGAGTLTQTLSVMLQIGPEGKAATSSIVASLAPDPELEQCFQAWSRCYGGLTGRCRPIGIPKPDNQEPPSAANLAARLTACEKAGAKLGDRFNQWLRQPSFVILRETWLEKLRPEDELRIIVQTQDREIQRLPWHQWDLLERYPKAEIALANLGYDQAKTAAPPNNPPVKILAILGDSSGIDVQSDRALLEQLPGAKVTFLVEPKRSELNDQLWQQPWQILFFAGHSSSETGQGRFRINAQETLTLEQLKFGLKHSVEQGLQLAIFNSCDGLGLAQEFAHMDIPQLIVMREPVPDRVAQAFLKYFLSAYGGGAEFYPAVRQARERLQALEGDFPCATWLPMIFQNPTAAPLSWKLLSGQVEATAPTQLSPNALSPGQSEVETASETASETAIPGTNPTGVKQPGVKQPGVKQPGVKQSGVKQPGVKQPAINKAALKGTAARLATASLLATAAILGIRHLGWLQPLELKAYDHFLQLRPQEPPDSRLLIIEVTEEDVSAQQSEQPKGSLSDTSLSKLLTLLNQHDPIAIGLDIYRDYPASNQKLSQPLKSSDHLVTVCQISNPKQPPGQLKKPGIPPPPEIDVHRQGFSDGVVDQDYVLRRHLLAASPPADSPCGTSYAFSTQLALRYLAEQDIYLELLDNGDWQLGQTQIKPMTQRQGGYQTEDLWGYQTLLNYRSHRSIEEFAPRVSLGAALRGDLQMDLIRDRIILIGTTAESFGDYSATPYSPSSPGVMLQAQMVSQLLSAALDGRPLLWILPWWGDLLWVMTGAGLGAGLAMGFHRSRFLWIGLGLGLGLHYGLCLAVLINGGAWLPLVPGSLALVVGAGLILALGPFLASQQADR